MNKIMKISIESNASTIGIVRPEYISTTLDWWKIKTRAWGNSSVIHADLTHPNLIAAAKGLSPLFIRIGGSQADNAIYNMSTSTTDDDFADACSKNRQLCLTIERWEEVMKFAHDTGARIVFTLAYIRHTTDDLGRNDQRDWDSTNARQLLQHTAQSQYADVVFGFELGNELTHGNKIQNITRLVKAYTELRHIIDETWSSTSTRKDKPKVIGPASTGQSTTKKLLKTLGGHIDIATYHKYHAGGKDPSLIKYAKGTSIIQHPKNFHDISNTVNKYMHHPAEVWVGEGAMAYNSGRQNITDSFVGSFWFTNLLGALSKSRPHSVYCRQALVGGHYELISHETMKAMPDYWVAHLWKKLVGTRAIGPILSPSREDAPTEDTFGCCKGPGYDTLLVHAFCAKEHSSNPIFVITNIDKEGPFSLNITDGSRITKYILTGKDGQRASKKVILNGNQLLTIENGQLPDIVGEVSDDLVVTLPPVSIAFVIVHGLEVTECETFIPMSEQHRFSLASRHDTPIAASNTEVYVHDYPAMEPEAINVLLVQMLAVIVLFVFAFCLRKRIKRSR